MLVPVCVCMYVFVYVYLYGYMYMYKSLPLFAFIPLREFDTTHAPGTEKKCCKVSAKKNTIDGKTKRKSSTYSIFAFYFI